MAANPESSAAPSKSKTPSLGIRLLWWFGIYFGLQLPLLIWAGKFDPLMLLFPMVMGWELGELIAQFLPTWTEGSLNSIRQIFDALKEVIINFPWFIYASHLTVSLCVKKGRHFFILIWILTGIVILNLVSCVAFAHNPPE